MPQPDRPSAQHASMPPHRIPKRTDRPANRHSSGKGWSRKPRIVAMSFVGVLALGGAATATVMEQLAAEVEVSDVSGIVQGASKEVKDPADPFKDVPVNILVMGTDFRDAENVAVAGGADEAGMRSDTTMLVHISRDRSWIHVVSIPRDSMVNRPGCELPDGSMAPALGLGQFNGAFNAGGYLTGEGENDLTYGAACTITTVMDNTGLPMPNHIVVKMHSVLDVVDAIGGVRVCLPYPIVTPQQYGGVNLPAGEQTLDGMDSLDYLRARHVEGTTQSDLDRIDRQQGFINALLRQILSADTMANPAKMLNLSKAVLGSVNPDPELGDARNLVGLAFSLKDIQKNRILFTTVPNQPWTQDPNRVEWTYEADQLWADLANDVEPAGLPPLEGEETSGSGGADGGSGADGGGSGGDDGGSGGDGGGSGGGGSGGGSGASGDEAGADDGTGTDGTGTDSTATPSTDEASADPDPEPSQPTGTCS
ncbi:LCP family protein [Myceligenerans pegani]|uniref:LCP family protein n=1 Tax=Myceligenerans pegani TaxID=2776917 RepID=A0ABR9N0G9_9MICO|nr:LCP family protein [Myceligenerans sp. TRM 65318]MBE1877152.1 LCP family protein [Myceligenerans sp. TRM 65318]MBE3019423.1 LCP family protein [Myceligenerans sp. TRM 65318]